jgi:hypothetical protein
MADSIGTLYVNVRADTKGLKKEITSAAALAGRESGQDFIENFNEKIQKSTAKTNYFASIQAQAKKQFANMGEEFQEALRKGGTVNININPASTGRFIKKLERDFKGVSTNVEADLVNAFEEAYNEQVRLAKKALDQQERDRLASEKKIQQLHLKALVENLKFDQRLAEKRLQLAKTHEDYLLRLRLTSQKAFQQQLERDHAQALRMARELAREQKFKVTVEVDRSALRGLAKALDSLSRRFAARERPGTSFFGQIKKDIVEAARAVGRLGDRLRRIGAIRISIDLDQTWVRKVGNLVERLRVLRRAIADIKVTTIFTKVTRAFKELGVVIAAVAVSVRALARVLPGIVARGVVTQIRRLGDAFRRLGLEIYGLILNIERLVTVWLPRLARALGGFVIRAFRKLGDAILFVDRMIAKLIVSIKNLVKTLAVAVGRGIIRGLRRLGHEISIIVQRISNIRIRIIPTLVMTAFEAVRDFIRNVVEKLHQIRVTINVSAIMAGLRRVGRALTNLADRAHKIKIQVDVDAAAARLRSFGTSLRNLVRRPHKITINVDIDKGMANLRRFNTAVLGGMDRFARALRQMGGRNAFINVLTNSLALFIDIGRLAAKVALIVADGIQTLAKNFQLATVNSGKFVQIAANVGVALSELAATGVGLVAIVLAIAAAMAAFAMIIGPLVALISGLVGIVTLLVSVLAQAAAGLAVLGPALLSVGAGIGAIVLGAKGAIGAIGKFSAAMNIADPKERAKALKEYRDGLKSLAPAAAEAVRAFEPLVTQFDQIRANVEQRLFEPLVGSIGKLQPILKVVGDGLERLAAAGGRFISNFIEKMSVPRSLKLLDDILKSFATQFENLGNAAGSFFIGLLNVINALNPVAELFSQHIKTIGENFAEWTAKPENQKTMTDFFTKAYDILVKVGTIVWNLVQAFGAVLGAGTESGEGLLDVFVRLSEKFLEWAESPEGQTQLKEWFTFAKDLAIQLLGLFLKLMQAFKDLDTPENRETLLKIINLIGAIVDGIRIALPWITAFGKFLWWAATLPYKPFKALYDIIYWIIDLIPDVASDIKQAITENPLFGRLFRSFTGGGGQAKGGIISEPRRVLVGEAGPEAIIPLTRPLALVDPSVRDMAALIRGKRLPQGQTTAPGMSKVFNNEINVYTTGTDPRAVAEQVVNRAAAMAS